MAFSNLQPYEKKEQGEIEKHLKIVKKVKEIGKEIRKNIMKD